MCIIKGLVHHSIRSNLNISDNDARTQLFQCAADSLLNKCNSCLLWVSKSSIMQSLDFAGVNY